MGIFRSFAVLALLALSVLGASPAAAQIVFGSYDSWLTQRIAGYPGTPYEIAPMTRQGDPTPGAWTPVVTDIFASILARAGITPCATAIVGGGEGEAPPPDRVGQLEVIDPSLVLDAGGKRLTFGYFVRAKNGVPLIAPCDDGSGAGCTTYAPGQDYFLLLSYDALPWTNSKNGNAADGQLCAFEVFTFGPVVRPEPGESFAPWAPLVDGAAVNGDGLMLQGVPLEIARPENYKQGSETFFIETGATIAGRGCRFCHDTNGDFPQTTLPFPWLRQSRG